MYIPEKPHPRSLLSVLIGDVIDIFFFLAPLVISYHIGWLLKPYFMEPEDNRGPWEYLWHEIMRCTTADRYSLFVYGTSMVTFGGYWLGVAFFMLLDYAQWPHFLYKYKINPGENAPPPTSKVIKMLITVSMNMALSQIGLRLAWSSWYKDFGDHDVYRVTTVWNFFGHMLAAILGHDFFFYHGHMLLHHKSIYKHIHKKHHEWIFPIAAAALYSHPIEHLLTGTIGPGFGFFFTSPSIPVQWIWYCWLNFQVQNDHSGYHFPIVFSPEFHDFHHRRFHTCYGWLHFWDRVWGTDIEFESSKIHKARHVRLHSLKSARELFPGSKGNSQ